MNGNKSLLTTYCFANMPKFLLIPSPLLSLYFFPMRIRVIALLSSLAGFALLWSFFFWFPLRDEYCRMKQQLCEIEQGCGLMGEAERAFELDSTILANMPSSEQSFYEQVLCAMDMSGLRIMHMSTANQIKSGTAKRIIICSGAYENILLFFEQNKEIHSFKSPHHIQLQRGDQGMVKMIVQL